jgi:hypothetical protein
MMQEEKVDIDLSSDEDYDDDMKNAMDNPDVP